MPERSLIRRQVIAALLSMVLSQALFGEQHKEPGDWFLGRPVHEVIEEVRLKGFPVAYSSQLVPPSMVVLAEPKSSEPLELLGEILEPHGLALKSADGIYLVVRARDPAPGQSFASLLLILGEPDSGLSVDAINIRASPALPEAEKPGRGMLQYNDLEPGVYTLYINAAGYRPILKSIEVTSMDIAILRLRFEPAAVDLGTLTVSTSRYLLFDHAQFFVDQRAIENLPDIGNDPVRSVHRLPGAAAGGWSAKSYFRGGEENETAIYLNGLRLLDPFHVRDYQNIFSSIDARSISGVEAYTGGFPVNYGNRMSGLLLLESQVPERSRHTELGISVFNTSLMTAGHSENQKYDWILSARNSNLKYILNKDVGEPSYNDIFLSAGFYPAPGTKFSFNVLRADDSVLVVTESAPEEREQSTSDTVNESIWLAMERDWTMDLSVKTVLSHSEFSNDRDAVVLDPEQLVGKVMDDREVSITTLKQDWNWQPVNHHLIRFGFELYRQSATYRYISEARYFGFYRAYPGVPGSIARDISASPDGHGYSLYLSDRFGFSENTAVEAGLRWDRQTHTKPGGEHQWSPRVSVFHRIGQKSDLRISWGRYHQSQGIHELQVEDGVDYFQPAQRAVHLIAGIHYQLNDRIRLRAEAYRKSYDKLRPRFENLQDSLALVPELEPDRARIAPENGRARGIELTLENRNDDELDWWVSYALSKVTDTVDGKKQKRNWDQKHAVQAGVAWHKGVWELGLAASIHSGWPTTTLGFAGDPDPTPAQNDDDEHIRLEYGDRNAVNFSTFASVDFRVSREWTLRNSRFSAFFELSNALNRKNQCCIDYDIEDEEAEVPVLEESIDYWLPILPAIGVLWEF